MLTPGPRPGRRGPRPVLSLGSCWKFRLEARRSVRLLWAESTGRAAHQLEARRRALEEGGLVAELSTRTGAAEIEAGA